MIGMSTVVASHTGDLDSVPNRDRLSLLKHVVTIPLPIAQQHVCVIGTVNVIHSMAMSVKYISKFEALHWQR